MITEARAGLSAQLMEHERVRAEHRLARARVFLLGGVTLTLLFFAFISPPADLQVQIRATILVGLGTCFASLWWWSLRRFGVHRRASLISSTFDFALAATVVLNWSIYPGGEVLPTQLKFGVGFGILLGTITLTAVRFEAQTVLWVTAECALFYLGLIVFVHEAGSVRLVLPVSESFTPHTLNLIDLSGRVSILLFVGGMLAFLNSRVGRLIERSIETTEQKLQLRQFISTNVVEAIESGEALLDLSGHRRRIAILFCDIRGFTSLSETLEPEALLQLLNGYYERAAREIFRHGGTLDKYIGDGVMALFGAPSPLENPSEAALRCGLSLIEAMQDYRPAGAPLRVGVGLHTDEVVVGNLGTEAYKSYTAIGRGVNMAARIESTTALTEPSLLFSRSLRDALEPGWEILEVGTFELKGIADPQPLFTARRRASERLP